MIGRSSHFGFWILDSIETIRDRKPCLSLVTCQCRLDLRFFGLAEAQHGEVGRDSTGQALAHLLAASGISHYYPPLVENARAIKQLVYFHNVMHYAFSSLLFSITYAIQILASLPARPPGGATICPLVEVPFGARDQGSVVTLLIPSLDSKLPLMLRLENAFTCSADL
jgi:hypothetical protein